MADDLIRYDLLVQDALRNVVRKVLGDAARDGLAGEHHFYVSFRTDYPGVRVSQRLREKYPQDMTIVLQHQFWDLGVTEHTFEVGLSFSGVPERLLVPFEAVTGFFDPSVQFGLKFELNDGTATAEDAAPTPAPSPLRAIRGAGSEPSESLPKVPAIGSNVPKILPAAKIDPKADAKSADAKSQAKDGKDEAESEAKPDEAAERTDAPQEGASVVSLDAFRKKS
ncbi:Stringent starvation protein B [Methylobacterium indicum]|uniref:SspB family protein n=2 Tax=Methylobacterium indicum TaxID=1775910 RepID=UPI000734530C|nr:ClpXP protease specificity-enhancing factor SspB [Methylobacterium indicum]KTS14332.1 Stringent starvation protein B [Methylobacterium indicum]KTS43079.1 Stringent starvation protein B [Methylobacterium indicum]